MQRSTRCPVRVTYVPLREFRKFAVPHILSRPSFSNRLPCSMCMYSRVVPGRSACDRPPGPWHDPTVHRMGCCATHDLGNTPLHS